MLKLALVCISVLILPLAVEHADGLAARLRGFLDADEVRMLVMIAGSVWLALLLLMVSLSDALPASLFIYGRF